MIVADSSYIAEGILTDIRMLRSERMLAPSLAVYEVAGAIWKHQAVLGRILEGEKFLRVLSDLLRTNELLTIEPDVGLLLDAYAIAVSQRVHPHDAIFVALALRNGLELVTLDDAQKRVYEGARSPGRVGP